MIRIPIILGIIFYITQTFGFNISPLPNIIHSKPFTRGTDPPLREKSAYFGFSLLLRQNSLLIGAPKANSTLQSQAAIIEPGALYHCSIFYNETCNVFIVEDRESIYSGSEKNTEIRNKQWLGTTISGDISETENESKFVVCAPFMKTNYFFMTIGACYIARNSRNNTAQIFKPFSSEIVSGTFNQNYRAIANLGMSSHWIKERQLFLLGAPVQQFTGTYVRYNIRSNFSQLYPEFRYSDANIGYAVSAGIFDNKGTFSYVISAPRHNYFGSVIILNEITSTSNRIYLKGSQRNEYFGYCLITDDLNNDGISDILVSAPFYSERDNYEIGAVYFYNGNNLRNLANPTLISPGKESRGKFGSSLASLGDINLDGYNDIAVGAPYIENGRVYIYHGSPNGLITKPIQILEAPKYTGTELTRPHYFGFSISGGVDIDRNGIKDIAISAINIDKVYIYNTYQIVNVYISFGHFPEFIHSTETNVNLSSCIRFLSLKTQFKRKLTFDLILKLDQNDFRMKFDNGLSEERKTMIIRNNDRQCTNHSVNIAHDDSRKSFPFELSYQHIQNAFREDFCENCVVVQPQDKNLIINKELFVKHVCGNNEVCNSNLKVELNAEKECSLILNKDQFLNVSVKISNYNDIAYLPRIVITNNHNLSLHQIPLVCSEIDAVVQCNLWNDQLFIMRHNQTETLHMIFDISKLKGSELIIEAKASSLSKEINETDNFATLSINLMACSEIEITEITTLDTQTLNLYEDQLEEIYLTKMFEIKNFGPSIIPYVNFILQYPTLYEESSSPIISENENFYIGDNKVPLPIIAEENLIPNNKSRSLELENSPNENVCNFINSPNLINYQHQIAQNISLKDKIVFDSEEIEVKELKVKIFAFENFKSGSGNTLKVSVELKIKQKEIWDLLEKYKKKYFIYKMNFLMQNGELNNKNAVCGPPVIRFRDDVYELLIIKIKTTNTVWIYVLSFALGILVYLVIALILYKIGFFRRKKHEEVKEFRRESLRRQSSTARASKPLAATEQHDKVELKEQDNQGVHPELIQTDEKENTL